MNIASAFLLSALLTFATLCSAQTSANSDFLKVDFIICSDYENTVIGISQYKEDPNLYRLVYKEREDVYSRQDLFSYAANGFFTLNGNDLSFESPDKRVTLKGTLFGNTSKGPTLHFFGVVRGHLICWPNERPDNGEETPRVSVGN